MRKLYQLSQSEVYYKSIIIFCCYNYMETLESIINTYIKALLTTYQINKKKVDEVFNTQQLNGYDAKTIKYISINVPPTHICR